MSARLALVAGIIVLGTWLGAGTAFASYDVTPACNSEGHAVACGGWHTSPVQISWTWTPTDGNPTAGSCQNQSYWYDVTVSAVCNIAGPEGVGGTTQPLMVEISTPTVSVAPNRGPDFNGWYNHPVAASVQGSAFSGIASCTGTTYAGPDAATASVSGTCTDNAGKTAAAASSPFQYDATAPPLNVAVDPGDRLVVFRWSVSQDLTLFTIQRTPGIRGARHTVIHRGASGTYRDTRVRNRTTYVYTITARDQAGNVAVQTMSVAPGPRLLSPAPNAHTTTPLLTWTPVRGAGYYNVQLFRGRKILSVWPRRARFQLGRSWRFGGRRYRLKPGRYRWYVWPGLGPRSAARYGPMIGARSFIVT